MKTKKHIHLLATAALLALAACTQDETAIPTGETHTTLPYGEYPLQIGGVTFDVESSAEPWSAEGPQTRVTEDNTDGKSSVWQWNGSEMIGVRLGNETATYTLNTDRNLITDRQLYWTSTAPATVAAWYPTNETVNLSDQSERLAYMLKAEVPNATYDNEITLGFKHQLAKVRVVLNGTQAALAQSVEVYGYTTCTNNEGTPTAGSTQGWLKMKKQTYGNTECWEANVVPGNITLTDFIRINGQTATINDGFPTTLEAAKMYTIDLTVGNPVTEITADNCNNISGTDNYIVRDNFGQTITVTGGSPTIYLENVNINVGSGNAINITSGNPTIHVQGTSSISSGDGAGIYVAPNNTVTITGDSRDDQLTVRGNNGGSGIGGYVISSNNGAACGNITISNVTVISYGSWNSMSGDMAAGIGSAGGASCGAIAIENATVHAYGVFFDPIEATPGIGCGYPMSGDPTSIPVVKISNGSDVHAHRGGSVGKTDYIGWAGSSWGTNANSTINLGGGTCTSSIVYCYTGETLDKTVVYDAQGNGMEL